MFINVEAWTGPHNRALNLYDFVFFGKHLFDFLWTPWYGISRYRSSRYYVNLDSRTTLIPIGSVRLPLKSGGWIIDHSYRGCIRWRNLAIGSVDFVSRSEQDFVILLRAFMEFRCHILKDSGHVVCVVEPGNQMSPG